MQSPMSSNTPFGGGAMASGQRAKNFKRTIKNLFYYMKDFKLIIVIVIVFAICSTVFAIFGPKILSYAITELFNGLVKKYEGVGNINFAKIGQILLFMMVIYFISFVFSFLEGWLMSKVSQKVTYKMRREISEKINRMPMSYFESRTIGDVLSRITNDIDTLGQSLDQSLTQLITSVCMIFGILIMMFSISQVMTLVVFVILPISVGLIALVVKFSQKYFKMQQNYLGMINGQIEEVIGGLTIVRLFNEEKKAIVEFKKQNDILFQSAWKSQFLSGLMMPIMNFVGNLGYVSVTAIGGILAYNGSISVGDIQAFIQYVRNFTQPISQLAQISNILQSMIAAAERVFEFFAEEEEVVVKNPVLLEKARGEISFEHVRFGYVSEKIIIKDFNSHINAGETVAIVGPTGAGKTTIVKLLMRFYDVNSGRIRIDSIDIKNLKRSDLQKNIGMVLQDTWLFKGTIMENIRYGKVNATNEEVYRSAKTANAHHFIQTLPKSYDMELNEESSNISQGQKQLLTIARAILADKPIMILDEATSSVDTRTEKLIQKAMNCLMKGRTSFVIAHRLSTIKDANKILVMDQGDIIEQGVHEELLAQNGFYTQLYNSQFEDM
ncbi:MAG: ABC transporter ATP-binding protein/permease [Streptococcaceae bacterium]|nr:ABC transporter ATP-binding protein/permease [Streptococcaceae bacterium]